MMLRRFFICTLGMVALTVVVWGTTFGQTASTTSKAVIDELVLINRMLSSEEMAVLGAYGHASVRNPGNPNRYFISRSVSPGLVTAADIYESDLDGNPVAGNRTDLLEERFIDGEVYRARPDVMAFVYTNAPV